MSAHTGKPSDAAQPGNGSSPAERAPDAGRLLAAIDIGTNSIRLMVAETRSDGGYRVIDDEKIITRLGRGLAETGLIHEESIAASVEAIAQMKTIADGYGVEAMRAIGTAATRSASNGSDLVERVRERCGLEIEVISAEDEARLAFESVAQSFDLRRLNAAIVDVGGGSTEVVLAINGVIEAVYTLPLGAVSLTERFGTCEDPEGAEFARMRAHVRQVLREQIRELAFPPQFMFGTGGAFTNLAAISMHQSTPRLEEGLLPSAVRGYELQRDEVRHTLDRLRKMPVADRQGVPGLSADRADIIVAGVVIVERLMKRLGTNLLRVHDRGIRDGLVLEMIDQLDGTTGRHRSEPARKVDSARAFGERCRYEEGHSTHVANLALQVFDSLAPLARQGEAWASSESRDLLECASLLHNVGYLINYSRHHKHSYHLIVHSEMPGFTQRELEIVANIARYHRRAKPKAEHPNFAKLTLEEQEVVRRLGSILRIADGLNRTHRQTVQRVELTVRGATATFRLYGDEEGPALWGAERKSSMFAEAFALEPIFEWASDGAMDTKMEPGDQSDQTSQGETP